jgi:hypothetical protein
MLGKAVQEQRGAVATQDKRPADEALVSVDGGALVDEDPAAEAELATRAPARHGKEVTAACCLAIWWSRHGAGAKKRAAAQAAAAAS